MFYEDAATLNLPLPEDILHLKHFGDLERLDRVLDLRIADENLPDALRRRLRLEKQVIARLPLEYPYDADAALAVLSGGIAGYTREELERDRDLGKLDWIYLNGRPRFHRTVLNTLVKTRPALEPRVLAMDLLEHKRRNSAALDAVIERMRAEGGAARRWHVRHSLRVLPGYERPGTQIRVHLPLPIACDYTRNIELIAAGPTDPAAAPPDAAQRTAFFEKPLAAGEVFFVEYAFETHMPWRDLDPRCAGEGFPEDVGREYLCEQPPHICFTPAVRAVAAEIGGAEANPLRRARRVYDFLTQRPIYSFVRNYFTYENLPGHMLTSMKGDCGIFALCFITLCRLMGIPARWQSGLYCAPHDVGSHDWAEFWCAPWGWLPVDASFGNAAWHAGSALRHEFYFGHLEPFRLPAARAFQAPFDPPKRFLRDDPYDNQTGEAEYADAPLFDPQLEKETVLLDWEEIPLDP